MMKRNEVDPHYSRDARLCLELKQRTHRLMGRAESLLEHPHSLGFHKQGSDGGTMDAMDDPSQVPGFLFIDHLAIAVPRGELESQTAAYRTLGFRERHREDVLGGDQVREVLLEIGPGPNLIQLLEPLSNDSPVQRLIDKNGGKGGFAHVAFRVESARIAFEHLKANGFQIIDAAPRPGSRGTTVFFVHPKSKADAPFGYLIEIVEAAAGPIV